ncbi:hypothetical protein HG535_0B03840 [Zygotorulaspora mrakii]|uniref:Uncharacterized protein n=1 Tax=Zygotorulaspora mrakii TaxID=42260 RepID=A0A7H9AYY3_ZYGMR|nr:uncharacterized protein HG535_0B03840 [Zygotorulaspora mrakii]QLG71344.1 hypothetical protein HG535_0B03840 [Zygotorulaspora mrakii]
MSINRPGAATRPQHALLPGPPSAALLPGSHRRFQCAVTRPADCASKTQRPVCPPPDAHWHLGGYIHFKVNRSPRQLLCPCRSLLAARHPRRPVQRLCPVSSNFCVPLLSFVPICHRPPKREITEQKRTQRRNDVIKTDHRPPEKTAHITAILFSWSVQHGQSDKENPQLFELARRLFFLILRSYLWFG